jgi:hypothetical protein
MSQGVAAARKRRAPASAQPPPAPIPTQQSSQPQVGLTLPQVIALVDKRLTIVESFMNESRSNKVTLTTETDTTNASPLLNEMNSRYELLAEEVINLKNIVLNLQSYTMDVNKTLMEERVRILSDVVEEVNEAS